MDNLSNEIILDILKFLDLDVIITLLNSNKNRIYSLIKFNIKITKINNQYLYWAAKNNDLEFIKILMEHRDNKILDYNAMIYYLIKGRYLDTIKFLFKDQRAINVKMI